MESAALIVHIKDAVMMMVGTRRRGGETAMIAAGLGRNEHIQRMLADQRRNAGELGQREKSDHNGPQPADGPR